MLMGNGLKILKLGFLLLFFASIALACDDPCHAEFSGKAKILSLMRNVSRLPCAIQIM